MKYQNFLKKGLDQDTNSLDVDKFSLRELVNGTIMQEGDYGVVVNYKGTERKVRLIDGQPDQYKLLGSTESFANVIDQDGNYNKREGITFFTWDSEQGSKILYYDVVDNYLTQMFPNPELVEDLDFPSDWCVYAKPYSDRGCHYVYFTDTRNNLRRIELRVDRYIEQDCVERIIRGSQSYPRLDELGVIKQANTGCIDFYTVLDGGGLKAGGYSFMYRKYNTTNARRTNFSNTTNVIPVILSDDIGGKVDQITNKKIALSIPPGDGSDGFDSIQLLVIKHISGSEANPENGFLLKPNKEWYQNGNIEYTGVNDEIEVSLADFLIDDLAMKSMGDFVFKQEKIIGSRFELQDFALEQDIVPDCVQTIQRKIGSAESAYSDIEDAVNNKSEFRGEQIAYGVYVYNEHGNGVVYPLDLSGFSPDKVISTLAMTGTVDSSGYNLLFGDTYEITIGDADLKIGDWIKIGNGWGEIIQKNFQVVTVDVKGGMFTVGTEAPIEILLGQSGNQSDSWTWKYASRADSQFTIFDDDGDISAIGLSIQGLKNWPSWAKGFEIVRGKRIKNIVGQTPHIPTIGVQGVPTTNYTESPVAREFSFPPLEVKIDVIGDPDYKGQLDYLVPKPHIWGHARNIVCNVEVLSESNEIDIANYKAEYRVQTGEDGLNEVSRAIYALPPEFMYGVDGNSLDIDSVLQATEVNIADAVAIRYKEIDVLNEAKIDIIDDDPEVTNINPDNNEKVGKDTYVSIFEACSADQFFYNREKRIGVNNDHAVQAPLGVYLAANGSVLGESVMRAAYFNPIQGEQDFFPLPEPVFKDQLDTIALYGNSEQLCLQQLANPVITTYPNNLDTGQTKNQKGLLIGLDGQLQDFTALMWNAAVEYFPFLDYVKQQSVLTGYITEDSEIFAGPVVETDKIIGGAYILNIERGLGSGRYGSINDATVQWQRTGVCQSLSQSDIDNNTTFDLEVFAGDCYITKHSFKISETAPKILELTADYDLVYDENKIRQNLDREEIQKVCEFRRNVEFLDVVLESEVNAHFENIVDQYPRLNNNHISTYMNNREYYYHTGYSKQNDIKPLVSYEDRAKENNLYRTGLVASETKLRGGESNEFVDVEGFDRFKANNIFLADGRFGDITRLIDNNDFGLTFIQEKKVGWIGIGLDRISTEDNLLLATGTSEVFGNSEQYISRDMGSQHPLSIVERDGLIYGVDSIRKAVWRMGPRGGGFEVISLKAMKSYFDKELIGAEFISGHIDTRRENYVLTIDDNTIIFNIPLGQWDHELPTKLEHGIGSGNDLFWFKDGYLYQAYEGDYGQLFGSPVDTRVKVVINDEANLPKILQSIAINCKGAVDSVKIRVCGTDQETEWLPLSLNKKNNHYWNNVLRSGRDKLKGSAFEVEFIINSTTEKVSVYSLITTVRKVI